MEETRVAPPGNRSILNGIRTFVSAHRSQFAKRGKREMCSFGSCKTSFEFLRQFRKVRNAFKCFVTQMQTQLPKTKRVWPMKINVICTVGLAFRGGG